VEHHEPGQDRRARLSRDGQAASGKRRRTLSRLYLIVGGAIVIALFAALIAPRFVNWNDYKSSFEAEAEKILGQPVHVRGSASATILPSPSLTFTDVEVGAAGGKPMMTVDRFEVTIELMPLLQGQFRVVTMKLARPTVNIAVDANGTVDWLVRSDASKGLDPDKVVLEDVEVEDGTISYADAKSGTALTFDHVKALIAARALSGPWRIDGTYLDGGEQVPFTIATGRVLDDGTIRVKTDVSPARLPVAVGADGVVGIGEKGLSYAGTFNLSKIVPAAAGEQSAGAAEGDTAGWRTEGSFNLTRDQLVIDKGVITIGTPDRGYSLAGSATFDLGEKPQFNAELQARQLDLDRALGNGPSSPVEVARAGASLVDWFAALPMPGIPGRVAFDVPAIVVGGAVVQDVGFEATTAAGGWRIAGFHAHLPGQATLDADGTLANTGRIGFAGDMRFSVDQPATFAAWWRGGAENGAGRLLTRFSVFGHADIAPGRLAVDKMDATIGDANISGRFAWSDRSATNKRRHLETDLKADRLDFAQLRAVAGLLLGKDPAAFFAGSAEADASASADSYAIKLSAGTLTIEDVTMRGMAIDASFADQALTVNEFSIGDLGGAHFNVSKGRIDRLAGQPIGALEARLEATTLRGLAHVVDRIAPASPLSKWLSAAAPALVPAVINLAVAAPAASGADLGITLKGVAAATTLDAKLDLTGKPSDWRQGKADIVVTLDSPDARGLALQAGLAAAPSEGAGGSHLEFTAAGIPAEGLAAKLSGDFGGLTLATAGKLALPAAQPPAFEGTINLASDSIDPLMKMAGLGIPGAAVGTKLKLDGRIATNGAAASLEWQNGALAGGLVDGKATLTRDPDGSFAVGGDLLVDSIDLGWITALGLGFAPLPTGDAAAPWSRAPFVEPSLGSLHGKVAIAVTHLAITDAFDVANVTSELSFAPNRLDFDLRAGEAVGGSFAGGLSIHNVGGNANVTGRVEMKGAALDSLTWQRAGRSVATGTLDASANFEATGRSPASLVSTLTGGGALSIRNGEARYVNPRAASLIVRSSDLGQEFTEESLADQFRSTVDAGTMPFDRADGAFAIAAGTIRLKSMSVLSGDTRTVGSAAIDLNDFTIDSDWTLFLDPGDRKVEGAVPQVGIVFRGPLAAPSRIIDVLQFGSYLSIRQEERIQEVLTMQEADRTEKERFNRLKRKLQQDAARREREAKAAEDARIAAEQAAEAARVAAEQARLAAEQARLAAEAVRHKAAVAALVRLEKLHVKGEALDAARAGLGGAETGAIPPLAGSNPPVLPRLRPPPIVITPPPPTNRGPMILVPQQQ
jgi:uncharacterized protein involved in outer membrane biogenesis